MNSRLCCESITGWVPEPRLGDVGNVDHHRQARGSRVGKILGIRSSNTGASGATARTARPSAPPRLETLIDQGTPGFRIDALYGERVAILDERLQLGLREARTRIGEIDRERWGVGQGMDLPVESATRYQVAIAGNCLALERRPIALRGHTGYIGDR